MAGRRATAELHGIDGVTRFLEERAVRYEEHSCNRAPVAPRSLSQPLRDTADPRMAEDD
jgi:hypothetical protein